MLKLRKFDGTLLGCVTVIVMLVLYGLVGGFATEYVIEYWGSFIKGEIVDIPFFPCFIAGIFIYKIIIPIAIITWLISFVI